MNKTLKGIIGGSVLLGALGGAMAWLMLTKPGDELDSSSEAAVETLLWHTYSDDISQIEVENPKGDSYVAFRKMEETKTTDMDGTERTEAIANYYLKGYEDLPMNTTQIRLLATRSPEVGSVDTVEENVPESELSKYGLDDPVKVTFTVDNADPIKFCIGSEAPIGSNRYLCMDGSTTVYLVNSISLNPFLDGIKDYLGTMLKPEQAEDDDTVINSVRIERSNLDYDFYFTFDSYYKENTNGGALAVHVMEEPVYSLLSADRSAAATHGLYGLTAKEVVTPLPTAAEIKKAGFDNPFVTVTMKTDDGKTTVFYLGDQYETEDGETRYFGMMKGLNCIYSFSPDDIIYDDLKPEDIISRNVIDMYVWDIGTLTYEAGDTKLAFTGEGTDQDDFVAKLNGKSLDDDGIERYRKLYTYLLQTSAEEIVYDKDMELKGDPMARIFIERQDKKRSYNVEFYDTGGMKAYIVVDGDIRFRCRKSYVDTLISNIGIFDETDKEFTMTW